MDQEYEFCASMAHILHDDKLTDMARHRPIGRQDKSIEHKCVPADSIIVCIVDMAQETHCQMAALMHSCYKITTSQLQTCNKKAHFISCQNKKNISQSISNNALK